MGKEHVTVTLVQLRHLISVAQSGSFSQSADQLHITQPALSRSIRALEAELGHKLFDRFNRHTDLTTFGTEVLRRAKRLVYEADDLADCGIRMQEGRLGTVRIGMGSGPGAMLMTPLLKTMATQHPAMHVDVARGHTELLVNALRNQELDALVIDARSLVPSADLNVEMTVEMRGAYMCRKSHPLARRRGPLPFEALLEFPIASTPLSDEVARTMIERYGPIAHPATFVTLRCDEISSLIDVVRASNAILVAIRAAAPDLVELNLKPAINSTARFGMVTLAGRTEAPGLSVIRNLIQQLMRD